MRAGEAAAAAGVFDPGLALADASRLPTFEAGSGSTGA
jgi:hypothetical protein